MNPRGSIDRFLEAHDRALFAGLFLAALLLRLFALDSAPLGNAEAAEAWGAWNLLRGEASASVSALYSSLTAGLLFLAGPSHWAPRLLPALAGAAAVFLPRLFLPSRGKLEALLAALLIAISPTLWISSVQAGGAAPGFLTAALCILYLRTKEPRPLPAGISLGLAATSGPVGWSGLALGAVVLAVEGLGRLGKSPLADPPVSKSVLTTFRRIFQEPAGPAGFLFGLAVGGTGLFFFPRGIGTLAAGLSNWAAAFLSGLPRVGELVLWMSAYEPVAFLFGAAGMILLARRVLAGENGFWVRFAAAAAVWILLRPAAFPGEMQWLILPLIILGAAALRTAWESSGIVERPAVAAMAAGSAAVLSIFTVLLWSEYEAAGNWIFLALPGLLILGAAAAFFLSSGNVRGMIGPALAGVSIALFVVFGIGQAGASWNAAYNRRMSANELFWQDAVTADLTSLRGTIERISAWQTGVKDELVVAVQWPEDSALGWELLTYGAAEYIGLADSSSAPPMLIAPYAEQDGSVVTPRLAAAYRGQLFSVFERRAWSGWPPDPIGWLFYREGPVERGRFILWVRTDILVPEEKVEP